MFTFLERASAQEITLIKNFDSRQVQMRSHCIAIASIAIPESFLCAESSLQLTLFHCSSERHNRLLKFGCALPVCDSRTSRVIGVELVLDRVSASVEKDVNHAVS